MDVIYQLPLPKDISSKIFNFACKSPHNDLGCAIFKKIVGLPLYNILLQNDAIVMDHDGFIKELQMNKFTDKNDVYF